MANKSTLFTALASLALLGCAPQSNEKAAADSVAAAAADPAVVRQAIEATNAKFIDALIKGDTATLMSVYASDAIVLMPNQPAMRGLDVIRTGLQGMLSAFTLSNAKITSSDLQVFGDVAIETGTNEMTMTPKQGKGKAITDKGKYVTVWQRQADGSWKIIRDIFNSDLPATG